MKALVWLSTVIPSLFIVSKYGGVWGVLLYVLASAAFVFFVDRVPLPRRRRGLAILAVATFAVLVLLFVVLYPNVNSHLPGVGSDDDDAYDVGVYALVAGHSPYGFRTYLGNSLHQFPGAFLAAAPFVLLGTSAWQNLFWFGMLFVVMAKESGDPEQSLRLAWVWTASPIVLHQVVTGTGHLANATYVLLALWWVTRDRRMLLPSIAWGCALASRANFFFLVPLAFGWLARERGTATASKATILSLLTAATLIVPFYLHDPAHFGPLEAADRLRRVDYWIPHGGDAIAVGMGLLAIALACTRSDRAALFVHCAAVQAVPILVVPAIGLVFSGTVDLSYLTYGAFVAPFVIAGAALMPTRGMRAEEGPAVSVSN
jgi:hypothetical protein